MSDPDTNTMTPENIRKNVEECLISGSINLSNMLTFQDKTRTLVTMGMEADADAVCHVFKSGDKLSMILAVGRSMLMGPEAYQWILDYHNSNPAAAKRCIDSIADYAIEDIPTTGECWMPFKDKKNKAWRAFKTQPGGTLKSVDEIRKIAFIKLGR